MSLQSYLRVLRLAAKNKLPHEIGPTSPLGHLAVQTLVQRGYLSAVGSRPTLQGLYYLEPKITVKGKELLRRLEAQTLAWKVMNFLAGGWTWRLSVFAFAAPIVWTHWK